MTDKSLDVAGVRPGDLLVDIMGNRAKSKMQFKSAVKELGVGDSYTLTVKRKHDQLILNAKVGAPGVTFKQLSTLTRYAWVSALCSMLTRQDL